MNNLIELQVKCPDCGKEWTLIYDPQDVTDIPVTTEILCSGCAKDHAETFQLEIFSGC